MNNSIKLLLVEDNKGDARLIMEMLKESGTDEFDINFCETLKDSLSLIDKLNFDIILLDLSLPDGFGIDSFRKVYTHNPGIPIILLTGNDDQKLALKAVRNGAQDYLVKDQINSRLLVKSIKYAIERKKIHQQIKENENFISGIADSTPTIVYIYDIINGKTIYVNNQIKIILGYDIEDFYKGSLKIAELLHPDESQRIFNYAKGFYNAKPNDIFEHQYRIKNINDEWIWLSSREIVYKRDKNGDPWLILGSALDITANIKSEAVQNALVKIAEMSNSYESLQNIYEEVHRTIESLLYIEHFSVALYNEEEDNLYFTYISQHDKFNFTDSFTHLAKQIIYSGKNIFADSDEILRLLSSKSISKVLQIPKIWIAIPLRIKNKIVGLISFHNFSNNYLYQQDDINLLELISNHLIRVIERKKHEEDLILSTQRAEQSDRLKSEFLAQMSHEIRTPLNSILTFNNMLQEELLQKIPSEVNSYFNIINKSAKRLIRTVESILYVSQIQSNSYDPKFEKIELYGNILKKLFLEFNPQAKEKNIELYLTSKIGSAFIRADNFTVYQIFSNLVDNAIKYTINGSVSIILDKDVNSDIIIKIKDTGIGISNEYLPKLFDPFSQEETGYTRSYEGNGLGMTIVKKFVELNKGEITVESEKGVGTEFTIRFKTGHFII